MILGYFIFKHNKFKDKLKMDLEAWKRRQNINNSNFISFCYFIIVTPEFRNVVLNRLHRNPIKYLLFRMMFKPMESLYINVSPEKIGGDFTSNMDLQQLLHAKKLVLTAV